VAEGGDLGCDAHGFCTLARRKLVYNEDDAEVRTNGLCAREGFENAVGNGVGGHVKVVRLHAKQEIANATSGEIRIMTEFAQTYGDAQGCEVLRAVEPCHSITIDAVRPQLILGIESSCDETSAAVLRNGTEVLSNVVASQLVHADYGGVVPELASREHLRAIVPVVREALEQAGVGYKDLDAVAVTEGPGLAGALLVGITFAKSLAFGLGKPLIAVNHLEGHIHAVLMEQNAVFAGVSPLLALVVSGGHTHLYLAVRSGNGWQYRNVGKTLDDAAGEAYDKAAKLLGLPYPGGPWMDALAAHGIADTTLFPLAQIKQKVTGRTAPKLARESSEALEETRFDMSFSGIKTAVRRYVEVHGMQAAIAAREKALRGMGLHKARPDAANVARALPHFDTATLNLIASFQNAVVKNLARSTFKAAEHYGARGVIVSGGVSANSYLRKVFAETAKVPIAFPTIALSTDNAAMIAAAGWGKFLAGEFAESSLEPVPQLRLG
jgi:N6-L-threonylcarbamoyladenine synthase